MPKNPYEILGVKETATKDEIKSAYRKLAKSHHPDMLGGTVDGFTKIKKAYELLSDQKRRTAYDVLHGVVKNSQQAQQNTSSYWSGNLGGALYNMNQQQYVQYVNSCFQQAAARNSAPPSVGYNKSLFSIPRDAILTARMTATYGVGGPADEIEIEVDCAFLQGYSPMPNDYMTLEFSMGGTSSRVDVRVDDAYYFIDSRNQMLIGKFKVRSMSAWQTTP